MKRMVKHVERMRFRVHVQQRDIDGGKCGLVGLCMHKVAIERTLRNNDPKGGDHKTRVDTGIIKYTFKQGRYRAYLPKFPKRQLIIFDDEMEARAKAEKAGKKFVSAVKPHSYIVEAERYGTVTKLTRERMDAINRARNKRAAEGRPDQKTYNLRYRVRGLGSV